MRTLWRHAMAFPFATCVPLLSVPVGVLAVVIGPPVSTAFDRVYHVPELIYVWGVVLLLGGGNVAAGIARRLPSIERAGLYVLGCGWVFYGLSVVVGLRLGGLVAGPLAATVGLCCWLRARYILSEARSLAAVTEHAPDHE